LLPVSGLEQDCPNLAYGRLAMIENDLLLVTPFSHRATPSTKAQSSVTKMLVRYAAGSVVL
jgi:hypothetical protein